jgi:RNA polymerase sigma-70 factor (ECF subfamily)
MADERSDEQLLEAFLSGDESAFELLIKRHQDRMFALALRMTGDRADALDATQDAFISALRNARSFKGTAAFSTWLYRIGINSCTDLLRRRKRLVPTEEIEPPGAAARVEETVSLRLDLTEALGRLTPDHREAVLMHDLGGLPYEDIAALTGVQLGTVKSRISRGRKHLAELLEQHAPRRPSKDQT